MALALVLIALALLLIGWVISGIRVVHAHHRGVLERFGRYRKVVGPGPHLTLRLVHTLQTVDERETVHDVPVDVLTGDDIPVALDLAVLWECSDASTLRLRRRRLRGRGLPAAGAPRPRTRASDDGR